MTEKLLGAFEGPVIENGNKFDTKNNSQNRHRVV